MPTLFASTLPKPHEPPLKPMLCQRACKANAEKNCFLKNFPTLQKKYKTQRTADTDNDTKTQ